ncbi:LytTR family DNA-binding domain-containing protein [Aneurinibacillus sp. Ricciae_BoGa-3]|uniref:LytTR family DNA-binding domain-containing protein n=1 Tax=Aneurinibacillus sp. Ricciae_BoGa-3 TaxID=3022697 RepID=UPI0023408404|nr:LytTR family DNA-binding domain-containing protein [Aneurinibacillus sp. Ricciae_BoGa-3]WCK52787.1 LytTR family DNA-binding domain-containing protein [Aneurinibacillus sp. Ricciae_BoGa-3]
MDKSSVREIVEAISQVFPQEASIAIADTSRFIYYQPSKSIDLKIKPGDSLKEGTVSLRAVLNRAKVAQLVDEKLFGMPYYGMGMPIFNGTDAEGCITAIFPPFGGPDVEKLPKHNFLIGRTEDKWIPIQLARINFIESDKGKTLLYTEDGVYVNKYTLVELERILPRDKFIRIHRAYIVNVNAIREIHPDFHSTFLLVIRDGKKSKVPVSQKYASVFRRMMGF